MGTKKWVAGAAGVLASALALSACTPTPSATQSAINTAKVATVAFNQAFFSYNSSTSTGNATANNNILYMTNDKFNYYNKELKLTANTSFGTYEKLSDTPLTVKQTVAPTASWSDGVPVSAADLVLSFAAQSGMYNTKGYKPIDADTGAVSKNSSKVFFNASSAAYSLIKKFPVIDGASVTYEYSKPFVDWELSLFDPGVPAHIVGKRALGVDDPAQAAQAVLDAFKNKDDASLAKISNVWNLDYNFKAMPSSKELVVGTGPYVISDLKEDQYVTLTKNPNYKGERKVSIDTLTVRFIPDPQASVTALQNGEVMVTQPQGTADTLKAMEAVPNASVQKQTGGTYEHVDMAQNNNGPFDPKAYGGDADKARLVRQAFLHTIPRQKIVDTLVKPLDPNADLRNSYNVVPGAPNYADVAANNNMLSTFGTDANIDKAKQLLTEAGVKTPINVRFLYDNINTRRVQEFQLIKESAEKAGFKLVDKGNKDWGSLLEKTSGYDAALFGWQSTSTGVTEMDANYRFGGVNNYYGYSSKVVASLLDQIQTEVDPVKQRDILIKIEQELVKDAFSITIFQHPQPMLVSNKLQGVSTITIAPNFFWNFWEWKLA